MHLITSGCSIRCSILLPRFSVEPDHTCLAILSSAGKASGPARKVLCTDCPLHAL